jgi:Tol biopolymer transport system component
LVALLPVLSGCAWITRASVNQDGIEGNSGSDGRPFLNADGRYVVFGSSASNLVPGDTNNAYDTFVRDNRTGAVQRVSVTPAGGQFSAGTTPNDISEDGRYVAFHTDFNNVVLGCGTLFVRDRQSGVTECIPGSGSGIAFAAALSGTARFVTFDSGGAGHVFVFDRETDQVADIPIPAGRTGTAAPTISDDGRYVAFVATAGTSICGAITEVYIHDRQTATSTIVPTPPGAELPVARNPSISGDGRWVTYELWELFDPFNCNYLQTISAFDRQTGASEPVSFANLSYDPDPSDDGRFVAFQSELELVPEDTRPGTDVYVRDRVGDRTILVSRSTFGATGNDSSHSPAIADDGGYVAFVSDASNLVDGDTNDLADVFVRVVVTPSVDSVTPATIARGTTATLTVTGSGFFAGAQATASAFTENGVTVNSVTVGSETELQVSVTVDADAPTSTRHLAVWNPGTGPGTSATVIGFCAECLTVT